MLNESFKLRCIDTKYTRVDNRVYAYCAFDSVIGIVEAIGMATCGKKDTFNKAKGRKLARARAELNAYATYRKRMREHAMLLRDKFDVTDVKLSEYIDHQKKYIYSIK